MVPTQFSTRNRVRLPFKLKKTAIFLGMAQDNLRHHLFTSIADTGMLVHSDIDTFIPYIVILFHLPFSDVISMVQSHTYLLDPLLAILFRYWLPGCRDG